MAQTLFRPEAVAGVRREGWIGDIHLRPSRLGWYCFLLALATVAAIAASLFLLGYTKSVTMEGELVPDKGLIQVSADRSGSIVRKYVSEGSRVHAGQALAEVSGQQGSSTAENTALAIGQQLSRKADLYRIDLDLFVAEARGRQEGYRARLGLMEQQIQRLEEQQELQSERADAAMGVYDQWRKLGDSGAVSRLQLVQQRDLALASRAQVSELERQGLQLRKEKLELQGSLSALGADIARTKSATDRDLVDLSLQVVENEQKRSLVLRAPADGVVANDTAHPGQSVEPDQAIMTIVPDGASLEAELWARNRSIGEVEVGDQVFIRYEAYPYQRIGQQRGVVRQVSRSAVSADRLSRLLGRNIDEQRYRILVRLDRQTVSDGKRRERLRPGMKLQASIVLNRAPLIDWARDIIFRTGALQ